MTQEYYWRNEGREILRDSSWPKLDYEVENVSWKRRSRPWWVCCFGRRVRRSGGYIFATVQEPWIDGSRYLPLNSIKTFKTIAEAQTSQSYLRGYQPFSDADAVVVIMHHSSVRNFFIQHTLGDYDD